LEDIGVKNKPILYVFNKIDKLVSSKEDILGFEKEFFFEKPYVLVSSEKDWNIDVLLERIKSYYKAHFDLGYIYA